MIPYRHGGDVYRNRNIKYDFSININPLGMPEFVRRAAIEGVARGSCYPDSECTRLRALAASHYEIAERKLIFGNGAAELIYGIVRAVSPRRAVVLAPSFTEYERALRAAGAEIRFFYLKEEDGFRLPTEEYLQLLSGERPDMIFLCNPANPAGNRLEIEETRRILEFCRRQGIFAVVDECFLDFLERGEELSTVGMVREGWKTLFVIQALTKSFAMAGLRLGFGFLSDERLLEKMRLSIQPWNVSVPAQEAGAAAFGPGREEYLAAARKMVGTEREYLRGGLEAAGLRVFPSDANFLLFKDMSERPERALYDFLLARGVLLRCCDDYEGLDGRYYRVCVRSREENRRLLEILGGNS